MVSVLAFCPIVSSVYWISRKLVEEVISDCLAQVEVPLVSLFKSSGYL